jgi:cyclopropane-fatty-acyl-phospholipid synthase
MIRHLVPDIPSQMPRLPADIALQLPQGQRLGEPNAPVKLAFSHWSSIARLKAGQIGALAEEYVEGKLQLEGAMRDVMRAVTKLLPGNPVHSDTGWWSALLHRAKSMAHHTHARDAAQIQFHYDVSDAFYALWLDPRRVYSCAYYRDASMSLAQAQEAKLDHICRKLMLKPGERFLDIGAGWGGLLMWAAEHYGVDATGITLSKNQHAHVQRLIQEKGLEGRVRMELRDYRDLPEDQPFDKVSSVGMFEHVGVKNYRAYFDVVHRCLPPQGLFLLHSIGANRSVTHTDPWIARYIFPNSMLPSAAQITQALEVLFVLEDWHNFGADYDRTLQAWRDNVERAWPPDPRYDERFRRMWRFYLAASMATFRARNSQLWQVVLSNGGVKGGYLAPR